MMCIYIFYSPFNFVEKRTNITNRIIVEKKLQKVSIYDKFFDKKLSILKEAHIRNKFLTEYSIENDFQWE